MNIVKKYSDLCNKDLCLAEDTRKMFLSFDFTPDNEGSFKTTGWKVLWKCRKLLFKFIWFIARKFTTKKVCWCHYPNLTNIVLPEVGNYILMHLPTKKVYFDNPTIKHDSVKLFERELKSVQCIIGYVIHKLYSTFKFSKNKDCVYSKL